METRDLNPLERKLTHSIIGAALTIHREFGPGLLERLHVGPVVELQRDCVYQGDKTRGSLARVPSFRSNNQKIPLFLVVLRVLRVLRSRFLMACSKKASTPRGARGW